MTDALTTQPRTTRRLPSYQLSGRPDRAAWTGRPAGAADREPQLIAARGDHLGQLVRSWRERLRPGADSGLGRRTRRKRSVSQEDVARVIGASSYWYARLERGDTDIYSADFLDRTAAALSLSPAERNLLYLYALGHEPVQTVPPEPVQTSAPLQQFVRGQTHPTCICDASWRVVTYNAQLCEWFTWMAGDPEPNLMRWAFTSAEAQVQLNDWETRWAPLLIAQLMEARVRYPTHPRLTELIHQIVHASEHARRLWASGPQPASGLTDPHHRLSLSLHGRLRVIDLNILAPRHGYGMKVLVFVPAQPIANRP